MFDRIKRVLGLPPTDTGAFGEQMAATWLERERGFQIVARNWRSARDRRAELDLVARDGDVLVFVEVKTRSEVATVSGYHAVDRRKRAAMRRACDAYLRGFPPGARPLTFRFDVIEVSLPTGCIASHRARTADGEPMVRHFENVALFRRYYRR